MTQQTERDDALIAEVARAISRKVDSFGDTERTEQQRAELEWPRYREHAKAAIDLILARENWTPPAKPDRYQQAWDEAQGAYGQCDCDRRENCPHAVAVLRKHFPSKESAITPEWSINMARLEGDAEIGAGVPADTFAPIITDEQIKQITNRFLGWKLPEDFHPDDGISFEPEFNKEWNAAQGKPPQRRTPTGTNLFNYTQAEAMVRFILADFILKGDV